MYSEPDSVRRLTTPLNAATPINCRALVRNPTVTGSSELRSNPKVIPAPQLYQRFNIFGLTVQNSLSKGAAQTLPLHSVKRRIEISPCSKCTYKLGNTATYVVTANWRIYTRRFHV